MVDQLTQEVGRLRLEWFDPSIFQYSYQSFQNPEFGGGRPQAQSKGLLGGIVGSAILPLYLVIVFAYALYVFFKGKNFHNFL